MTGIDRVEFAYLEHLSSLGEDLFALCRTRFGYVLLDQHSARSFAISVASGDYGSLDALGMLPGKTPASVRRAEAALRRICIARCLPRFLAGMLRKHCPRGIRYINVSHAGLTDALLEALTSVDAHIAVLVHDAIPLQAPDWQAIGRPERFAAFLGRVAKTADLVIYPAEATRRSVEAFLDRPPRSVTAHLGVVPVSPCALPPDTVPEQPYFVSVGTIEPRKNHELLLDIWARWDGAPPRLILVGQRGWRNERVFETLDRGIPGVTEVAGLTDGQVAHLLDASHGLLFPSHLEGFGLPPLEAAALGVPVLAQPLAVFREVMGNVPIYADPDPLIWKREITRLATARHRQDPFAPPSWADHFNAALRMT